MQVHSTVVVQLCRHRIACTIQRCWRELKSRVAAKDAEIAALKNNYDELIGIGSVPGQEDFEACSKEAKKAHRIRYNKWKTDTKSKMGLDVHDYDNYIFNVGLTCVEKGTGAGIEVNKDAEIVRLKDLADTSNATYRNVCGVGEKPFNHTMRALQLDDLCPQDVKDARMKSYNHWVERVCNLREIDGDHVAQRLEKEYPEYYKLVNTFADFDVRLWAMREDLAELNLHHCEKLVEELAREKRWFGFIGPVKGGDYMFELAYRFTKNEPAPLPEPEETRPRKSPRRKSSQPQSTDT